MSIERVPITPYGYDKMKKELENLIRVERPSVIKAIEEARAFGDLSENAEYESAKDRQSFVEGRIQELESKVSRAEIINPDEITNKDRVTFGLTVKMEDLDTGEEVTYQLVGPDETEPENGKISITSPIGRAMLGKQVDDDVSVNTPGGLREFAVLEIL
ncbi:MAG: transcription elongation factor GreA [Candidatus Dadabacteria bacterium]|nr:transcription elongation factor GreA [Candidatus Dadabacteria bacterium]NIS07448.1 transcription elongation factor GreA [Candidatus Dadabacteria bacterium]NIY21100.1 transcription elongation factor GreA [Candidatus Dadabacteria bacterium]